MPQRAPWHRTLTPLLLLLAAQSAPRYNLSTVDCTTGCLFNIQTDPSEYEELSQKESARKSQLMARWVQLNATSFQAPPFPLDTGLCAAYLQSHSGFLGPYYSDGTQE